MVHAKPQITQIHCLRLNPGDDVLEKMTAFVREASIDQGIILNGAGSLSRYHFHVVADQNLPPKEAFVKKDEAVDVIGMSGMIIDGRVHAHITLSTDEIALGGHVEPGCHALTFMMITVAEVSGAQFSDWDSIKDLG